MDEVIVGLREPNQRAVFISKVVATKAGDIATTFRPACGSELKAKGDRVILLRIAKNSCFIRPLRRSGRSFWVLS